MKILIVCLVQLIMLDTLEKDNISLQLLFIKFKYPFSSTVQFLQFMISFFRSEGEELAKDAFVWLPPNQYLVGIVI